MATTHHGDDWPQGACEVIADALPGAVGPVTGVRYLIAVSIVDALLEHGWTLHHPSTKETP